MQCFPKLNEFEQRGFQNEDCIANGVNSLDNLRTSNMKNHKEEKKQP